MLRILGFFLAIFLVRAQQSPIELKEEGADFKLYRVYVVTSVGKQSLNRLQNAFLQKSGIYDCQCYFPQRYCEVKVSTAVHPRNLAQVVERSGLSLRRKR